MPSGNLGRAAPWLLLPIVAVIAFFAGSRQSAPEITDSDAATRSDHAIDVEPAASSHVTQPTASARKSLTNLDSLSTQELRQRYRALAAAYDARLTELARLRGQSGAGGSPATALAAGTPSSPHPGGAAPNPLKQKFYPLNPEELEELAKDCTVRVDQPPLMDSTPGAVGEEADEFKDVRPQELAAMKRVVAELHRDFRRDLAQLYEEAVGHPPNPELANRAMLAEIQDKSHADEPARLMTAYARQLAGQSLPPSTPQAATPDERAQRAYLALGDEFQKRLATRIGPERAHELRSEGGGWPWRRSQFTGCEKK